MSIAGIFTTALSALSSLSSQATTSRRQQLQEEFQQLGQDLESGNLSGAQTDFTTLQQMLPQSTTSDSSATSASSSSTSSTSTSTSSTSSSSPTSTSLSSLYSQLGQDLQSGNLSAAQQDYTDIEQKMSSAQGHHHHHHGSGSGSSSSELQQTLAQLGQALQSGSLTSAQTAYSQLQQEFTQLTTLTGSQDAGQYLSSLSLSV
jgi:outer membrane protein assembly factor BamD (BamD/ComL family)